MVELKYDKKHSYFYFYNMLWERKLKIKVMTESEDIAQKLLQSIIESLQRIDRNKKKISAKIFEDRYGDDVIHRFTYADDIIDEFAAEPIEHFESGIYISNVRAEIYNNGDTDIYFTIRSRYKYHLDLDDECVLYSDHSFEV